MVSAVSPDDFHLRKLVSKIQADRGIDLANFRMSYVARRVATRLAATGAPTIRSYLRILEGDEQELTRLLDALTVNVSEFFRDASVYEFLADVVVPEIVLHKAQRPHSTVRVWSAGCSTGQEPYSIAMLLLDEIAKRKASLGLSILGTDIDHEVLNVARVGCYPIEALRQIPPNLRLRYTEPAGSAQFRVTEELISVVRFRRFDLFADKPISAADLIMCRNVMIYFDRHRQSELHETLLGALRKGGFLVLGKSEKLVSEVQGRLLARSLSERVYQVPA